MTSNNVGDGSGPPPTGNVAPPKPWERAPSSTSGPTPFRPSSVGGTSDVVEGSGTAKPGEIVSNIATNVNTVVPRPPIRPWEQQTNGNMYGGYGSGMQYGGNYNSGYGSSMYGGGLSGGAYGSSMYGNSMYRGGLSGGAYGSNMYGGGMSSGGGMYGGGGGMYGGGMYGAGGMGGYGVGMGGGGGPYGNNQDPNNPFGSPAEPPGFWMSLLRVLEGVVNFFGRISILIDQNTQALSNFMMAMLHLFDRSGILYGELARFVLRVLGIRTKSRKQMARPPGQLPGPGSAQGQNLIEGPKVAEAATTGAAAGASWDNVWGNDNGKAM